MNNAAKFLSLTALFSLCAIIVSATFADVQPPRGTPQRRTGGESFPPLPLPATPLRRTEEKHPPEPPVLIARIRYGSARTVTINGADYRFEDWNTDPGALRGLLREARAQLRLQYGERSDLPLAQLDANPAQIPILYLTGHIALDLSDVEIAKLKAHIDRGGFLWGEACCGESGFSDSFRALVRRMYPDRAMTRLPADHPLFYSFSGLPERVRYSKDAESERPDGKVYLEGLDLGCRTAVILSPYDLSCGWDDHDHENDEMDHPFRAVMRGDAVNVGLAMIAYCLDYHQLGRFLAEPHVYYQQDENARGEFTFGQIAYPGNWDTDPSAAANLLTLVQETTSSRVRYQKREVRLATTSLAEFPILYMTGHEDFRFSEADVRSLREYLSEGGFMLADACCGRQEFAIAFKREIRRVVGEASMVRLPMTHSIFHSIYDIDSFGFTPFVNQNDSQGGGDFALEGVDIEGATRVIFSSFDLGNGWEMVDHPFTRGLDTETALKLGVNIIVYSMTH
ncbi:MAG: DUF4159 domain-containing protein [Planctomycetes bacterium]|nr:DUF4159 domain-containing protein [Planctomycetota bacterium]